MRRFLIAAIFGFITCGIVMTAMCYVADKYWKEPQWGLQSGIIAGIAVFVIFLVFVKNHS